MAEKLLYYRESTSLGDLRERETRTALKIDILGIHQSAKGLQRLAGKEVCLSTLDVFIRR